MKPIHLLPYTVYYKYQRAVIVKYGTTLDLYLAGKDVETRRTYCWNNVYFTTKLTSGQPGMNRDSTVSSRHLTAWFIARLLQIYKQANQQTLRQKKYCI
jgi:hypothetical protein